LIGQSRSHRRERAVEFLRDLGAGDLAHPGGDLLSHLVRTHDLLTSWGATEPLSLAGLCHAAYGTDGFPTQLLAVDDRSRLRNLVGDDAETIVYTYCACDRGQTYRRLGEMPLSLTDRFTGEAHTLATDASGAFALLTIANELDLVRAGNLPSPIVDTIGGLLRALAPYAPHAAELALQEFPPDG